MMQLVRRVATFVIAMLMLLGTASIHYSDPGTACGVPPTVLVKDTTALNRVPVPASPANSQCSIFNDLLPSRYSCGHRVDIEDLVERAIRNTVAKIRQRFISGR